MPLLLFLLFPNSPLLFGLTFLFSPLLLFTGSTLLLSFLPSLLTIPLLLLFPYPSFFFRFILSGFSLLLLNFRLLLLLFPLSAFPFFPSCSLLFCLMLPFSSFFLLPSCSFLFGFFSLLLVFSAFFGFTLFLFPDSPFFRGFPPFLMTLLLFLLFPNSPLLL